MLTALHLKDFKSFADATLTLGPFTVIVGTNASGKSNIRDALRFLHGLSRGYSVVDVLGGKYGAGGQWEWAPIRGGSTLTRFGSIEFSLKAEFLIDDRDVGFSLNFNSRKNNKHIIDQFCYIDTEDKAGPSSSDHIYIEELAAHKYITGQDSELLYQLSFELRDIRFLDLHPDAMRHPSFPGQTILGDRGENLPTVLEAICTDPQRKAIFASWLNELIPSEVKDLEFPRDPNGRVYLTLVEHSGNRISAESASDGTLRFLALLAALLGPDPASLYFLEEIETGIHPSRLHLLLDLIEHQTEKGATQVIATTHSADLLNVINDRTFANTSLIYRDPEDGISRIYRVSDLPNADGLRHSQGLGRLLTTGWMETMIRLREDETS